MVVLGVTIESAGSSVDVLVECGHRPTSGALHRSIGGYLGSADLRPFVVARTGQRIAPGSAETVDLRWGDRLAELTGKDRPLDGLVEVVAIDGPRAGARWVLGSGPNSVHRGADAVVDLTGDPAVSRGSHTSIEVGDDARLRVVDVASRHGTSVDGAWLDRPAELVAGGRISLGDSELAVAPIEPVAVAPHLDTAEGGVAFGRPPRVIDPPIHDTVELAAPPDTPRPRRFPLGAALIPVVLGGVMFMVTRSPVMLLFVAMGPAMAVWSWVEERTGGRSEFRRSSMAWRATAESAGRVADDRAAASAAQWRAASPSPVELVPAASERSASLWQRRTDDADHAVVRIGVARQASRVVVQLGDGGDPDLRRIGADLVDGHAFVDGVPVTIDLRRSGIVGISGARSVRGDLARSIVVQLATLHSPNGLSIVVLGSAGGWEWARWLPHARVRSVDGTEVAGSAADAAAVLHQLAGEVGRADRAGGGHPGVSTVVVIDGPIDCRPAEVAGFLAGAADAGIAVVWSEREPERLPHGCGAVVHCSSDRTATLVMTRSGQRVDRVAVDPCPEGLALAVARWISPLVDVSSERGARWGRGSAGLASVLEVDLDDPGALVERWRARGGDGRFLLGLGDDGPVVVDLHSDGPHMLVGGTTGSGKSAALRSWLVSMAAEAGPDRLNIMLVDYKASAAFQRLDALPHVVATITNLDRSEAERALVSLEAELSRRQQLLVDHHAEDLVELRRAHPDAAPARLVIVVDEFRALKEQVPAFIDGLVDLAARGRNVGMHLILATQRPEGAISADIQANTNLRVALRTASPQESRDLIGEPTAAFIPVDRPGRGLVSRAGSAGRFESVYVDGWSPHADADQVSIRALGASAEAVPDVPAGPTDLERFVDLANAAAVAGRIAAPRRPWHPPLPSMVRRGELVRPGIAPDGVVLLGLLDDPGHQSQRDWFVEPAAGGGILVLGDSGSGTSTLVRRMLLGLAARSGPSELAIYAVDATGRGLSVLAGLPQCGGVIPVGDAERVGRLAQMLTDLVDERSAGAGRTERSSFGDATVWVVIDGFGTIWAEHADRDGGRLVDLVGRLATDGPGLGIRLVVTADRRGALTPAIIAAMRTRFVMRLGSSDEYAAVGLRDAGDLPVGRVLLGDGTTAQVAWMDPPEEEALVARISAAAAGLTVPPVRLLPEEVDIDDLPAPGPGSFVIGLDDGHRPALVDVGRHDSWLVLGPNGSGRTTALVAAVTSLDRGAVSHDRVVLCARRSRLAELGGWVGVAIGPGAALGLAEDLVARVAALSADHRHVPLTIVVDDLDELIDSPVGPVLEGLWRAGRDVGARWLVSIASYRAATSFDPLVRAMLAGRHGLVLQPDPSVDGDLLGVRLPRHAGRAFPVGRGHLVAGGSTRLVQVARARPGPVDQLA